MTAAAAVATALAAVLASAPTAHAAPTAERCLAAKLKAAGVGAANQLICYSTAAYSGQPVNAGCLTTAATKFAVAFARIETPGGCAPAGDLAEYVADIDAFVADVVSGNLCAAKLKAAGSAGKKIMACQSKAAKKSQPVDTKCVDKAHDKFALAIDKGDAKGCMPTGDAAAIGAQVDGFIAALTGPSTIRLFATAFQPNGALGNRATTTALCAAAATSQSLSCGSVLALLSYTGDVVRDFPANHSVPSTLPILAGAADTTLADNWADLLDGTWDTCLTTSCIPAGPVPAGIGSMSDFPRTGTLADGTLAANCQDWTNATNLISGSVIYTPCYGVGSLFCLPGKTFDSSDSSCNGPSPVLCLCY